MIIASDFFIAVGPWKNWEFSLTKKSLIWGVKDDKKNSNLYIFKKLIVGSIVFFYSNQDKPTKFSKRGVFGIGKVIRTYDEYNELYWPDELAKGKVIYTHRFEMEPIMMIEKDSDLLPWIDGLPFTKGLNHIAEEVHLKKLLHSVNRKWNIEIKQEYVFPLAVNGFYRGSEIRKVLKISPFGGIRINKDHKFIVVFSNAVTKETVKDRFHNIYHDKLDDRTGVLYYTGQGQVGNQTLSGPNLALDRAKKEGKKIHLFRRYEERGLHEYLGEVEVIQRKIGMQNDADGKKRKVIIFALKPISGSIEDSEANEREIEFEVEQIRELGKSSEELKKELTEENKKIKEEGPKTGFVTRKRHEREAKRRKRIIAILKNLYFECQVCGTKHFEKKKGLYSEVHHIIPWSETYDDSWENLVVVCANCHKKFDHAKDEIKKDMYQSLKVRFPNITYNIPDYVN